MAAASRDDAVGRAILRAPSADGRSVGEVLRAAETAPGVRFKVQGASELSPDPSGERRVAVCYWLGDVRRAPDEATCGIRFLLPADGAPRADPYTRALYEGLLGGRDAFLRALAANFREVCGDAPNRRDREC